MLNFENGKKLVRLAYLTNLGAAALQLLANLFYLLFNSDDLAVIIGGIVTIAGIVGAAATILGFGIMWYTKKEILLIGVPAVYVVNFILGFINGFILGLEVYYFASILSLLISIVSLGEYGVWFLLIKNKNKNFALGLIGVCGISVLLALITLAAGSSVVTALIGSLVSCIGMGICFLSADQLD